MQNFRMSSKLTLHEMSQLTIDLSTLDLENLSHDLEMSIDVLSRNCVSYFRNTYPASIIINMDDSYSEGSHWCALLLPSPNSPVEYFDSFGQSPPHHLRTEEMDRYGCIHNPVVLQHPLSSVCGYYSLYFLIKRVLHHHTMDDILAPMIDRDRLLNDRMVMEYVLHQSST